MPIVTAAGYPTLQAPTVGPAPPPTDYQNIPGSDPAAFGATVGEAQQRFGQTIERSSDVLFERALAMQGLKNRDEANSMILTAANDVNTRAAAFESLTGKEAAAAYPQYQKDLFGLRDKYRDQMSNPASARIFDENFVNRLERITYYGAAHAATEQRKAMGATSDAVQRQSLNDIAQKPDDEKLFQDSIATAKANAITSSHLHSGAGPDDPVTLEAVDKAVSAAYGTRIDGFLRTDPDHPERASRYWQQHSAEIRDPATRDKIENMIATGMKNAGIKGDAERAINPGATGDLWSRVKRQEGGIGPGGEVRTSSAGAIGISQILPSTARAMAEELGVPYDEAKLKGPDQTYNEQLGKAYLDKMMGKYGNETLAAAAYNAGPERVDQWIQQFGDPRTGAISLSDWASRIPIPETRNYVRNVAPPGAGVAPTQNKFTVVTGDSIAAQQVKHGRPGKEDTPFKSIDQPLATGATTGIGDPPQRVLQRMQAAGPDKFSGQVVFLSPGTSNDPTQMEAIGQQLNFLKNAGAKGVVVPGVGPGVPNQADVNAKLKSMTEAAGFTFFQPDIKWQKDGVHPLEIDRLHDQALTALNSGAAPGTPGAPAPATRSLEDMLKAGDQIVEERKARGDIGPGTKMSVEEYRDGLQTQIKSRYNMTVGAERKRINDTYNAARIGALQQDEQGGPVYQNLPDYLGNANNHELYDELPEDRKAQIRKQLDQNATLKPMTPERYTTLKRMLDMAVAAPDEFVKQDFEKLDLPVSAQKQLDQEKRKIEENANKPQAFTADLNRAKSQIKAEGLLLNSGIDVESKTDERSHRFVSALATTLNEFLQEKKRPMSPDEVRAAVPGLLRTTNPGYLGGWLFGAGSQQAFENFVPRSFSSKAVPAYIQRYGKPPTPQTLIELYHNSAEYKKEAPAAAPDETSQ